MTLSSLSPFLANSAAFLRRATGKRRLLLAFAFGSAMALTMPPVNAFPLLFVCLPALIFLLQGTTSYKQAFFTGWSFAFGFFVFGLYWIAASMFVDIGRFWWAVPFSVAGLPAFFAIYYGIAAVLARRYGLFKTSGAIAFGLLWFLADYARGHVFTGFPWNLLGYAWSGVLPLLQSTAIFGIYGLTLLTCLAACLPASLAEADKHARRACLAALLVFVSLTAGGILRLQNTAFESFPDVRLRLVQPNIAQTEKWLNSTRERNFQELIDLSTAPGDKPVTHIFWPETASTFYLSEDAPRRKQIAEHLPAATSVITGVIRRNLDNEGNTRFYNSMVAVDGFGRLTAGYDKAHLVPFGEFMPLRRIIPLHALAASDADFTAGPGPQSVRVRGLPLFSPLICYEAIFPGAVTDPSDRPDFIVNFTNDGWYGNTSGPYQHFSIVRVRAIEEGLSLIRIANTGISGVIDSLGRVTTRIGLGEQGFIDSDLPRSLPPTIFVRAREIPVWLIISALFATLSYTKWKKK